MGDWAVMRLGVSNLVDAALHVLMGVLSDNSAAVNVVLGFFPHCRPGQSPYHLNDPLGPNVQLHALFAAFDSV
jgi:hypothetical protein